MLTMRITPTRTETSSRESSVQSAAREEEILRRIRALGQVLDNQFGIPGTSLRIGWDGIIGLIPGFGDVATGLLATYLVYLAYQLNVPRGLLAQMISNVLIDVSVGAVPVVGDLLDVAWKANLKNVRLLERHLQKKCNQSSKER